MSIVKKGRDFWGNLSTLEKVEGVGVVVAVVGLSVKIGCEIGKSSSGNKIKGNNNSLTVNNNYCVGLGDEVCHHPFELKTNSVPKPLITESTPKIL